MHLEHDPAMRDAQRSAPDPTAELRKADATRHRRVTADGLAARFGGRWVEVSGGPESRASDREAATAAALTEGHDFIWGATLPRDPRSGRRGTIDLLVRSGAGYVPVLVVRHKVTDPGTGARTSPLAELDHVGGRPDSARKVRPQPRDQLRLAHTRRLLQAAGFADERSAFAGVIGMDGDAVVWHDLQAPTWPGGRTALAEYDSRFADRIAVATAAATGTPALAEPSRIVECRSCPWWPVCEDALVKTRDVSLVVRGEDAGMLRSAGVTSVDALAGIDPYDTDVPLVGMPVADAVGLARAWLADLTVVRRTQTIDVPRADVEVDVDMESFGDAGAYLWGVLLSGADIGEPRGYRAFVSWEPLPTDDEARSFAEFWRWLTGARKAAADRGLTFRAYCYNELAENRWLLASAKRFAGFPGVPRKREITQFIESDEWFDLFGSVREHFLCSQGKGLKTIAPVAGFAWRDPEAGGENSMRWYRDAVGLDGDEPVLPQRTRLLEYNEDDVRATAALRAWMTSPAVHDIPYVGDI